MTMRNMTAMINDDNMVMMLSLESEDSHSLAMVMKMTMKIVIVKCKRLVGVLCDGDCDECDKGSLPIPRVNFFFKH